MATQTDSERREKEDTGEICVSRVDSNTCMQEEKAHNVEPPTMTITTQLEASLCMITEGLVARIEKTTNTTELEENTAPFRQKLQRLLSVQFIAAAAKNDKNLHPLLDFVKKGDWEAIKTSRRQYMHSKKKQIPRQRGLYTNWWKILNCYAAKAGSAWKHPLNSSSVGSHARFKPTCLVPAQPSIYCPNGSEM